MKSATTEKGPYNICTVSKIKVISDHLPTKELIHDFRTKHVRGELRRDDGRKGGGLERHLLCLRSAGHL